MISTNMVMSTKTAEITITDPMITGKSKLFNNLCQGDQKTGISKNSVTENICWKVSNYVYPERGLLTIIDTPGIEK